MLKYFIIFYFEWVKLQKGVRNPKVLAKAERKILKQSMRKRLERLVVMGVLSASILATGIAGCAEESVPLLTVAETEPQINTESAAADNSAQEESTVSPSENTETEPISAAPATEPETTAPITEETSAPTTEGESAAPTESETIGATEGETAAPTESETVEPTEGETAAPTESETIGVPEEETAASTESETVEVTEEETEMQTETSEGLVIEDVLDEVAMIIDNSLDEEKLAEIEAEARKKADEIKKQQEEEARRLYEMTIGESIIDFYSYPAGNITENTNKIYDYLVETLGLNHAAACGILANIQCESNFVPTAVGDGGTSYGLCQWHLERFARLVNWCNTNGYNYHLVEGQMEYLQYELKTLYVDVYEYVRQVPNTAQGAYDAAYYWCAYYEIPDNTFARARQRGNMAVNEFFPRELGMVDEAEEITPVEETENVPSMEGLEELIIGDSSDLRNEIAEFVYRMYRLDIPQNDFLILN